METEGKSPFLDRKGPRALAQKIKDQLEVMTPSISAPVRQMSGGNVQKVLVGREIAQNPKVLLVAFPTRGVDLYVVFIFVLYYIFAINTIIVLSIFNYLRKFNGRVLYLRS